MGTRSVTLAILLLAGCSRHSTPPPLAPTADAGTPRRAESTFELIDRLAASLPLDPDEVGEILGTRLVRDRASDTPVLNVYAPAASNPAYDRVELRLPDAQFGSPGEAGLLIVTLASDGGLGEDAIVARFGQAVRHEVPSAHAPRSVPSYLVYERPWGTLSIGVTNDDARKLVSFVLAPRSGSGGVR